MSEGDIEKAVKEAAEYEAQDKKRKEAIDTRNEADSFVFQTEKALEDVGDKIPEADKASVQADPGCSERLCWIRPGSGNDRIPGCRYEGCPGKN